MGPLGYPNRTVFSCMESSSNSTNEHDSKPVHSFEWRRADGPSSAVIMATSEVSGDAPEELEPLYTVVDPDSLNSLFARKQSGRAPVNGSVEFEYNGYWVVINANGRGHLYESADQRPSVNAPLQHSASDDD